MLLVVHLQDGEEGFQPELGARELRRLIRREIEAPLAKEMLGGKVKEGDSVTIGWPDADGPSFKVDTPAAKPAAKAKANGYGAAASPAS